MKIAVFAFAVLLSAFTVSSGFLAGQKLFERVRTAFEEKETLINRKLANAGIKPVEVYILLTAYKAEGKLELYAKRKAESTYKKLVSYDVCARSGGLGPKRRKGDKQVPEGFYVIDRFNPNSQFYLSLGINYPNQADRLNSTGNLGGDIFLHGKCVTAGCLPLTDDKIKELYLYAVLAHSNGQQHIPVYLFPFRMTDQNLTGYTHIYQENPGLIAFWKNLKQGYDTFTFSKAELPVSVNTKGEYVF